MVVLGVTQLGSAGRACDCRTAASVKIVVKLIILVVLGGLLGMGSVRQRRTGEPVPRPLFISVGVLSFVAAAIAILW